MSTTVTEVSDPATDDSRPSAGFLTEPEKTEAAQQLYARDLQGQGYIAHLTRLWATSPESLYLISESLGLAGHIGGLDARRRQLLITAAASAFGDSYCSLVFGSKLASTATEGTATAIIAGRDPLLSPAESALVSWARRVTQDPNSTTPRDVEHLRAVGFDDRQIFGITLYVALRLAFATVNDALGAVPDLELVRRAPAAVVRAVDFGRAPAA